MSRDTRSLRIEMSMRQMATSLLDDQALGGVRAVSVAVTPSWTRETPIDREALATDEQRQLLAPCVPDVRLLARVTCRARWIDPVRGARTLEITTLTDPL